MISKIPKLWRYSGLACAQSGKGRLRQVWQALRLMASPQHLGIDEYYEFEVFDDSRYPCDRKTNCVGWRGSATIDKCLNDDYWRATANDKILNYALLNQYGAPIPQTIATYSASSRRIGSELSLQSQAALESFLNGSLPFPVFVKPVHGTFGRGTYSLASRDHDGCFVDTRGATIDRQELLRACQLPQYGGMLFQELLHPHPKVAEAIGHATSCVRIIVAITPTGPKIHMAFWKIARAHNITDNFCRGESGNLLAWINSETGTVERVISGFWPDGREITTHPDTGRRIVGDTLPDWPRARALCLNLAPHFHGLRLQHWDVAFCADGPVIVELNTEADLGVPQFLGYRPFIDETLSRMLASTGR